MNQKFYSEYGEDRWIWEHKSLRAEGVFVDIGCGHPDRGSNTAFLRRSLKWSGLAIDGNPDYAPEWKDEPGATFIPAVIYDGCDANFQIVKENSSMSRICDAGICNEGERVKTVRISDILRPRKIQRIDLLSIDIEGHEYDVLRTMDLAIHAPRIIIAEYNTLNLGKDYRAFEMLMSTCHYHAVHQTVANIIYFHTNP